MEKKILFTDLDGTLLTSDKTISEYTFSVLRDFSKAGNILVLSSGRPLKSILEVRDKSGLNFPGVMVSACNGAQIYDCDSKTTVIEKRLSLETVSEVQHFADLRHVHVHTYSDESIITETEDAEVIYYTRHIHMPLILSHELADALTEPPFKMLAIELTSHSRLAEFGDAMVRELDDRVQVIFSNPNYLEIIRPDAGKGNGVHLICDHLGIPYEDSYSAGDSENDISMLTMSGCGIAMSNGTESARLVADHVTDYDNDHDGLARFIAGNIL
jgi:Cof subfamily protein (haloacid dehalogenase superfamily)